MKKTVTLLVICLMLASLILPCSASEFENYPITDAAELLTYDEFEELSEKAEKIREKYNFDVAIITEYEMETGTAEATADDYYDEFGFGAGENDDGILFYISMDPRKYHFSTHADGLRVFNDNGIDHLKENVEPYLRDDDYYGAMNEYLKICDEFLEMAANGKPYGEDDDSIIIIIALALIPLLIAWVMMKVKLGKMKTAVKNDYAANYVKQGSKRLEFSRDIFLYSQITRTEKPKNTSSSSHTSSSGRTHGGGGGSF